MEPFAIVSPTIAPKRTNKTQHSGTTPFNFLPKISVQFPSMTLAEPVHGSYKPAQPYESGFRTRLLCHLFPSPLLGRV